MALFFIVFLSVYAAANYYIFLRGWQALEAAPYLRIPYIIAAVIFASLYVLCKVLEERIPAVLYDLFMDIGSFWFAYMLYFFLAVVLFDVIRLANHFFNFYPDVLKQNYGNAKLIILAAVFIIVNIIVLFGYLNTRNIQLRKFDITLAKKNSALSSLNITALSDIHVSTLNNENLINNIVEKVNATNPDIILIGGDIVDDRAHTLKERGLGKGLTKLKAKYGIYAINGNHEFINGVDPADIYMQELGIKVLRDTCVMIDGSFYLAGREDRSMRQTKGKGRKDLSEILKDTDKNLPVLLMDHTPLGLEDAAKEGVDFQFSGHTHNGQLYPLNYITGMIYKQDWGFYKEDKTLYYVSCGAGTWGPAVRTGSISEILNFKVTFVK